MCRLDNLGWALRLCHIEPAGRVSRGNHSSMCYMRIKGYIVEKRVIMRIFVGVLHNKTVAKKCIKIKWCCFNSVILVSILQAIVSTRPSSLACKSGIPVTF